MSQLNDRFFRFGNFGDFHHFARFQTAGTHLQRFNRTFVHDPEFFQVGVPAPPRFVIRVTDVVAEHRAFIANFTSLGHRTELS